MVIHNACILVHEACRRSEIGSHFLNLTPMPGAPAGHFFTASGVGGPWGFWGFCDFCVFWGLARAEPELAFANPKGFNPVVESRRWNAELGRCARRPPNPASALGQRSFDDFPFFTLLTRKRGGRLDPR